MLSGHWRKLQVDLQQALVWPRVLGLDDVGRGLGANPSRQKSLIRKFKYRVHFVSFTEFPQATQCMHLVSARTWPAHRGNRTLHVRPIAYNVQKSPDSEWNKKEEGQKRVYQTFRKGFDHEIVLGYWNRHFSHSKPVRKRERSFEGEFKEGKRKATILWFLTTKCAKRVPNEENPLVWFVKCFIN